MRVRLLPAVLLLVFTWLPVTSAQAGGGRCVEGFVDAAGPEVATSGSCFVPAVVRVDVGGTVRWRSGDGIAHNVVTQAGFGGDLPVKQSLSERFDEPGVYPYVCTLHPGMAGAVVVGDGVPTDLALAAARVTAPLEPRTGDPVLWGTLAGTGALLALVVWRRRAPAG